MLASAMVGAIGLHRHGRRCLLFLPFMLSMMMNWCAGLLCAGGFSYHFSSYLELHCARCGHFGRHHLADPAAHRQQGNHQGED